MRSTLHLVVLLTISYFVHGLPTDLPASPGEMMPFSLTGRIVNGTKAVLKQFPHQVSLMRSWSQAHFCGGSLISTTLVLTAGHCMFLSGSAIQPWTITVVGGIVNLINETSTRQKSSVASIRIHPEFDLQNLYNDVAILQLSESFTFTPELHSVPLTGNPPVPNTICQVSGWGYPSSDIPIVSPDLMYVDLPIRSVKECRELLENVTDLPSGMYCAGYLEGGKDACQGDSGGGMICNGVLTGIVSGGEGCAEPRMPGVYADVFHYLDWILMSSDVVAIVQKQNNTCRNNTGNYAALNTPTIMVVIISFLFGAVINYT